MDDRAAVVSTGKGRYLYIDKSVKAAPMPAGAQI